jgi:hypothetical protein
MADLEPQAVEVMIEGDNDQEIVTPGDSGTNRSWLPPAFALRASWHRLRPAPMGKIAGQERTPPGAQSKVSTSKIN